MNDHNLSTCRRTKVPWGCMEGQQQSLQKWHLSNNYGIVPRFPGRIVPERMTLGKFRDVYHEDLWCHWFLWLKVGETAAVTPFLVSEPWPPHRTGIQLFSTLLGFRDTWAWFFQWHREVYFLLTHFCKLSQILCGKRRAIDHLNKTMEWSTINKAAKERIYPGPLSALLCTLHLN